MAYKVGLRKLFFEDAARSNWEGTGPRPLLTDVWYPAVDSAIETDLFIGSPNMPFFNAGKAARDAELAFSPESFPLVLISHGTGGIALGLGWLASRLASNSYIVAGVNHHGNNGLESYTPQGFLHYWERPMDLTVMLDRLLADPIFGARIHPYRIGAAGFSLGGYTVIALAGGVTRISLFIETLKNSGRDLIKEVPREFPDPAVFVKEFHSLIERATVSDDTYRDERVKSVFAIAPVLGEAFSPDGLSSINIPVKIVVGSVDQNAPVAGNASYFAKHIPDADLTILEKVGHYTFLAEATEAGKQELPMFCLDPEGVDRASIHQTVSKWANKFFDNHLKV